MLNQQKSLNLNVRTQFVVKVGLLSAIAFILCFLELKLPVLFPGFLKLDISEVPILVATTTMGLGAGIVIEFLKNLLHMSVSSSQFIGEFANFSVGVAYVLGVWGTGRIFKASRYRVILSLVVGGLVMAVFASIFNYFVLLPLYVSVLHFPMKAIVGMTHAVNPAVNDVGTLIVAAILPFNILKSAVAGVISYGIIKKVGNFLQG